jgi:hypothetical protein
MKSFSCWPMVKRDGCRECAACGTHVTFLDPHFDEAGLRAFRRIQWDFHPSGAERGLQIFGALVLMTLGAFIAGRLYHDYRNI